MRSTRYVSRTPHVYGSFIVVVHTLHVPTALDARLLVVTHVCYCCSDAFTLLLGTLFAHFTVRYDVCSAHVDWFSTTTDVTHTHIPSPLYVAHLVLLHYVLATPLRLIRSYCRTTRVASRLPLIVTVTFTLPHFTRLPFVVCRFVLRVLRLRYAHAAVYGYGYVRSAVTACYAYVRDFLGHHVPARTCPVHTFCVLHRCLHRSASVGSTLLVTLPRFTPVSPSLPLLFAAPLPARTHTLPRHLHSHRTTCHCCLCGFCRTTLVTFTDVLYAFSSLGSHVCLCLPGLRYSAFTVPALPTHTCLHLVLAFRSVALTRLYRAAHLRHTDHLPSCVTGYTHTLHILLLTLGLRLLVGYGCTTARSDFPCPHSFAYHRRYLWNLHYLPHTAHAT